MNASEGCSGKEEERQTSRRRYAFRSRARARRKARWAISQTSRRSQVKLQASSLSRAAGRACVGGYSGGIFQRMIMMEEGGLGEESF